MMAGEVIGHRVIRTVNEVRESVNEIKIRIELIRIKIETIIQLEKGPKFSMKDGLDQDMGLL